MLILKDGTYFLPIPTFETLTQQCPRLNTLSLTIDSGNRR